MSDSVDKGILIVEDHPIVRKGFVEILAINGFSNVYEAENVAQCLSILSEHGDDIYVVLLDLRLPDGHGLQIMEHLVNSHAYIVGVIVLTAYGEIEFVKRFFQLGTEKIIAVDFRDKISSTQDQIVDQVKRTANLIESKRKQQSVFIQDRLWKKLELIENELNIITRKVSQIDNINTDISTIMKNSPSFLKDLGMDIVRIIIIGMAVLAFLYLDLGGILSKIIERAIK